ncbi:Nre family DNA repair protein [Methanothermobacter tenebrarum]|uniref:DNA repair protein n=1 Tax=Methanothermobacter tenebrarum TaxID=680118 RepID=A0A328PHT2_9EURY|nr:Nre family DNA repair protein [Methanothermobacter tenebrarum]MBC7117757.1 hypothetical protein [Methanobacteriaceae archaeon]NPV64657.1 hypothetical protein [Methanobacteriaceae archaeon]RAO78994.1 hypothetical protein DPC56_04970 [Methanothermobacter tenebrarum]
MIKSKYLYLEKLTKNIKLRSSNFEKEMEGSTPPSVFIGSYNYPKVYAGPLVTSHGGDVHLMDLPEEWIPKGKTLQDIIGYRLNLVRGKQRVHVKDFDDRLVEKLQEITLAKSPVDSEVLFSHKPRGIQFFGDENPPHGPSAPLEYFEADNVRWDRHLESAYYDTDLRAADAIYELYRTGVPFSSIQKSLSVGALGVESRRKLVPTRWSITACDSILADRLLRRIQTYDIIDSYRVHEFESFKNKYIIILTPTRWRYEWIEVFLGVLGSEKLIFSDHEIGDSKREYSRVGGCYYSSKMAVLDALDREEKQAGAIVLREAYKGYIPLGVFNVRENVKNAMKQAPMEFNTLKGVLKYVGGRLKFELGEYIRESRLLKEADRQASLDEFTKGGIKTIGP